MLIAKAGGWFGLISIICISLLGFKFYFSFLTFIVSFLCGVLTILYLNFDKRKLFPYDVDVLDNPLEQTNFSIQLPKVLNAFTKQKTPSKFDQRITGSETVDSFLNEIINIVISDYITPWYEILTADDEFTNTSVKQTVIAAGANLSNRIKSVDWVQLLSLRFPEEITTHLKLFKQSRVRLKHASMVNNKDISNGNAKSPKKGDKLTHRRNKSETDAWFADNLSSTQTYGKSKFYSSSENLDGKTLTDLFFDLESLMEDRQLCRDTFCLDLDKELALLSEVSEAILYLVAPEEAWNCHPMKMILIDLLAAVVLRPILSLLSDPDNINRVIIKMCCKDSGLPTELFLMVIRCSEDAEELDATLELVQKEIQKLHSRDSVGECELPIRQQLSSLQYLTRIINARRASLGPQEGLFSTTDSDSNSSKVNEDVKRSLQFLSATTAWRANAQYLLEIELNEPDSSQNSKLVLDNLRASALEICDTYLASNTPPMLGLPENCYSNIVRKITTENDEFANNPVACFDELQKCIFDALEDVPMWQTSQNGDDDLDTVDSDKESKTERRKYSDDMVLGDPSLYSRHNRSRSDIVGNSSHKLARENTEPTSLSSSMSHSDIDKSGRNKIAFLTASIIETALVQDKGKTFGIYAIAVTRKSDNEVWHIYRRYSDFYDLHTSVKERWPELSHLPFPAKKTFQNTSRSVLERRKIMLNSYLQSLTSLVRETRYADLLSDEFLGGFLSPENQAERHTNTIDALLVNSLRTGLRTLKNMPDQFANTVDGVMDGISKVFQGKTGESAVYPDGMKTVGPPDSQDEGDESVALRLLEEALGIRGLWLRRRLLAPLRTILADRINKKVLEYVSQLTSPRNIVQYLKYFKQWLVTRSGSSYVIRDQATKARTRVAAKVALMAACSDDLKHIVGSDTAKRGLLTVFELFQTQEINRRLLFVLLEAILNNLFPENNMAELFRKLYSSSPRVQPVKKNML